MIRKVMLLTALSLVLTGAGSLSWAQEVEEMPDGVKKCSYEGRCPKGGTGYCEAYSEPHGPAPKCYQDEKKGPKCQTMIDGQMEEVCGCGDPSCGD